MQVNDLSAAAGASWFREAFALFRRQPLAWMSLAGAWFAVWFLLFVLPVIGQPLVGMLQPAFFAGFVLACRDQQRGGTVTLAYLFAAFRLNGRALVMLGALALLVEQLVLLPFALAGAFQGFELLRGMTPEELMAGGIDRVIAGRELLLIGAFAAVIVVEAVFWFAPALLVYRPMPVSHALRWSFYALVSNPLAMLVFAALTVLLFVLAAMPWFLGMPLMLPVYAIAHYTSFVSVFRDDPADPAAPPPSGTA